MINQNDFTCDEILRGKLKIFQPKNGPRVNIDTMLLSAWVKIHSNNSKFLEPCCATGAISLILALKFKGNFKITGLEIQEDLAELAKNNLRANNISEQVEFINGDLRDKKLFKPSSFDGIVINPPYESQERSRESKNISLSTARLDLTCSPYDVAESASRLLKSKGRLFAVFNTARLPIFINAMTSRNIIPKRLKFVHPKSERNSNIFLIECIKDAGEGLIVQKPLIIYDEKGNYTDEVKKAYEFDTIR